MTPTPLLEARLGPLVTAYAAWIEDRKAELKTADMAPYQGPGQSALERCRDTLERIEAGVKLLLEDEKAAMAFRFANLAMWQQRVHTLIALAQGRPANAAVRALAGLPIWGRGLVRDLGLDLGGSDLHGGAVAEEREVAGNDRLGAVDRLPGPLR